MAIANPWFVFVEFVLAFQSPISSRYIYRSPLPQKEETCKHSDVPPARMTTRTLLAVKNRFGFLAANNYSFVLLSDLRGETALIHYKISHDILRRLHLFPDHRVIVYNHRLDHSPNDQSGNDSRELRARWQRSKPHQHPIHFKICAWLQITIQSHPHRTNIIFWSRHVFYLRVLRVLRGEKSFLHHTQLPQPACDRQHRITRHESCVAKLQSQRFLQQQRTTAHNEHLRKT